MGGEGEEGGGREGRGRRQGGEGRERRGEAGSRVIGGHSGVCESEAALGLTYYKLVDLDPFDTTSCFIHYCHGDASLDALLQQKTSSSEANIVVVNSRGDVPGGGEGEEGR